MGSPARGVPAGYTAGLPAGGPHSRVPGTTDALELGYVLSGSADAIQVEFMVYPHIHYGIYEVWNMNDTIMVTFVVMVFKKNISLTTAIWPTPLSWGCHDRRRHPISSALPSTADQ